LAAFDLLHRLIDSIETGAHRIVKNATFGQNFDPAGPPGEQRNAQTILDALYLVTHRRLRHAEFTRCEGQIFQSPHRFENAKTAKVPGWISHKFFLYLR